jgi:polysaccharide export outer membrane protein
MRTIVVSVRISHMRLNGLFVLLMLAPAMAGCASMSQHRVAELPRAPLVLPPSSAWASAEDDSLRNGDPMSRVAPPATPVAAQSGPPTPAALFARVFQGKRSAPATTTPVAPSAPSAAWAADIDSLRYGEPARDMPVAVVAAPTPANLFGRIFQRGNPPATVTVAAPASVVAAPAAVVVPVSAVEEDHPYTFDTGDRLRITVFGQDGLSNSYVVDAQGNLSLPLIGTITARALTGEALSRLIADRLRKGFIREPHVSIEVEIYRPFFILGEVTAPGQYPYVPNMTVQTAVAIAGGFTPRAYRWDISVDRPAPGGVVRQTVPPLTRLRPGDTVVVKERWF